MKKILLSFLSVLLLLGSQAYAQTRTVTGTVVGKDDGLPLPGVTVLVQGTKRGTQTGPDGGYSIKIEPGQSLTFSFIGFASQTIAPPANGRLNVTLSGGASELNDVVVIGYGTQVKRAVVGSIAQVKGKDVTEQPVQNFEQALAGRASGVQVTIPNGVTNTPPNIHIRGTNSISLSAQPLFVVDGIVVTTGDLSGGEAGGNALANINPDDIESIDIAKDGPATAIYGSRAANGVVFVTTKKGKKGSAVVSLNTWVGENKPFRLPKVLNAAQYIALKNEALVNAGLYNPASYYVTTTPSTSDPNGPTFDTDWEKLIYRTGTSYNATASISGGTDKTTYYASANYSNQQGIIRKNNFNTKGLLFNVDHRANKYISVGLKLSYADQQNLAATSSGSLSGEAYATAGLGRLAVLLPPNIGAYNADGSYNLNPLNGSIGLQNNRGYTNSYPNPIPSLDLDRANNEQFHTTANAYVAVNPVSWITLKTQYSIDYINSLNDSFSNPVSNFTVSGGVVTNAASATDNYQQYKNYVWDNTLQVDQTIGGKHNFSLLLGNEQQQQNQYGIGLTRSILSDPAFNVIQAGFANVNTSGLNNTGNYLVSFFGRLSYNFNQKYYLTGSLRRDGFSPFGSQSKYGYFPGLGGSWAITKEKFWSGIGADKLFSSFNIKASYAKVGNAAGLNNYASYGFYSNSLYNANATLTPSQTGNDQLKWETSKKLDIGFNFGLFNDRITGEVDYYKNNVDGLIFQVPLAPSAGLPTNPYVNVGSLYNKGLEINLNADILRSRDFSWSANFNISFNKNRITKLIDGTNQFTYSTSSLEVTNINRVGGSVGDLYIIKSAGIDPNNGRRIFVNGKGQQVEYTFTGTQHWYYMDGSNAPAINQTADAGDYGNTTPKEFGGFSNNFRYKNIDLSILFTYQLGFYDYYGTQATLTDQRFWNNSTAILNHWTTPGQAAAYPKVVFGDNVSNGTSYPTDFNTYRGDFLKLKTINLGYTLPKRLLGISGLSSLRVYVTAQNLFVITKYPGPDPEVSSNGSSINGNSTSGVDRNTSPNYRSFTAGLSVKF